MRRRLQRKMVETERDFAAASPRAGRSRMIHESSKRKHITTSLHPLLKLQQSIGNRAVARLIQAKRQERELGDAHARKADLMGAKTLHKMSIGQNSRRQILPAALSNASHLRSLLQRAMKFELQTTNQIFRNDGKVVEPLGRKYGPTDFLAKGSTGVRLESETHGVLEFETDWFRKWPELKEQIEEAAAMTQKMNDARDVGGGRKAFPFNVDHLRKGTRRELRKGTWERKKGFEGKNEKILGKGEELEVKIRDSSWQSGIQSSESFLLEQYESYLREHEWPELVEPVVKSAQDILDAANTKGIPAKDLVNLRSFLQIIVNYIKRGQGKPGGGGSKEVWKGAFANVEGMPAKQAFVLMSRTDFASMYRSLLSKKEKALFKTIVKKDVILDQMGLDRKSPFFIEGYGTEAHRAGPTVHQWLVGIYRGKDLLKGLSAAMGRHGVESRKGKKDTGLVKFETRNTVRGTWKKANNWVDYAKALFWEASTTRKRDEGKGGTGLKQS